MTLQDLYDSNYYPTIEYTPKGWYWKIDLQSVTMVSEAYFQEVAEAEADLISISKRINFE